jgi:2-polyprenyl-3-methyl-5-hydroxy-6-metoxy-1,4-benzoquinol methylase
MSDYSQLQMVHRLPPAQLVDRFAYLCDLTAGRRVIHIGFVDSGCQTLNTSAGAWLHEHLARTARELVGIDVDVQGVEQARADGYEAYAIDCCDVDAVRGAGIGPADVVVAGEVIEHLDDPGSFIDAVQPLVVDGGVLAITTPNATGLVNSFALLANYEVNHPDHVAMFTCQTLDTMLVRHGWEPFEHRVFLQSVKSTGATSRDRMLTAGARAVLGLERALARLGRPYAADGLIAVARRRAKAPGPSGDGATRT